MGGEGSGKRKAEQSQKKKVVVRARAADMNPAFKGFRVLRTDQENIDEAAKQMRLIDDERESKKATSAEEHIRVEVSAVRSPT